MSNPQKTTIVFFGHLHQMTRWAREHNIEPRIVVIGSNPNALRGRTGDIRAVYSTGWLDNASSLRREIYDTSHDHMQIILARGGKMTKEWA